MANGLDDKWFPTITNQRNATQAMQLGATAAALRAALRLAVSLIAIYSGEPVLGRAGVGLFLAAFYFIAAWRVHRLSLPWAIAGLTVYTVDKLVGLLQTPRLGLLVFASLLFLPYYWNAVRGGLFLRKVQRAQSAPPAQAAIAEAQEEKQVLEIVSSYRRSTDVHESRMPQSNEDEYSEFLECMRRGERKFQKAGYTLHQEYAAWLKDHRKKRALVQAAAEKASSTRPA
jgi:hypothetical protein